MAWFKDSYFFLLVGVLDAEKRWPKKECGPEKEGKEDEEDETDGMVIGEEAEEAEAASGEEMEVVALTSSNISEAEQESDFGYISAALR